MRFAALVLCLLALTPATALAGRGAVARLVECDRAERAATFRGEMRPLRRAEGMEMRFALQARESAREPWRRLKGVEGFGTWQAAEPGRPGFIVDKRVENLVPGLSLRALVRFRWRDADGRVAARDVHLTRPCRQPENRANLVLESLTATAGSTPTTALYSVRVANRGRTEAPVFTTSLEVGDELVGERSTAEPLRPGDSVVVTFEAPRCEDGSSVTATADLDGVVDEAEEMDNMMTVPCPPPARAPVAGP